MNQSAAPLVSTPNEQGCTWQDVRPTIQTSVGLLHGVAAFFVAETFGWSHQFFTPTLLFSLFACLTSGVVTARRMTPTGWRFAVVAGVISGLVMDAAGLFVAPVSYSMLAITVFCIILTVALLLPYQLQPETGDGCLIVLRYFTAISIICVVIFLINDASFNHGRNLEEIGLTLLLSIGILVGELVFARHVQTISTKINSGGMRASEIGMLTLGILASAFGPVATVVGVVLVTAAIAGILFPVAYPVMAYLSGLLSRLHLKLRGPSSSPGSHPPMHKFPLTSPASHGHHSLYFLGLFIVLLAVALWFVLRSRHRQKKADNQKGQSLAVQVLRDKKIHPFRLVATNHPVRLRFQKRLLRWHEQGVTIETWETPHEFMARIPSTMLSEEDRDLATRYERVRYNEDET